MMKTTFLPLLLAVLLTNGSCQSGKPYTDDDIRSYMARVYDGLDPDDLCIHRSDHFPNVAITGTFAHDRGCMQDLAFVGSEVGGLKELTPQILALGGWQDESKRADLALNFVEDIYLAYEGSSRSRSNEDFELEDTPEFSAPASIETGDGYTVTCWVREPSGMMPEAVYYLLEVKLDKKGNIVSIKSQDSFVVEY